MSTKILPVIFTIIASLLIGCTTYHLTTASLNDQLSRIDTSSVHEVYNFNYGIAGVLSGGKQFYNAITEVQVTDTEGNKIRLKVTPHTGVKITDKNGAHKIVCFDTMFIRDSLVYGNKSHLVNMPIKPFHLSNIAKLELQE
jgi:hypothetical protein